MTPFTTMNLILLLVGLVILAFNVAYSAFKERRGLVRAGVLNVLLVLVACVLIGVGLVRIAFPMWFNTDTVQAVAANSFGRGGPGGNGSGANAPNAQSSDGSSAPAADTGGSPTLPARLQTAIAADQVPPALMTSIAQGTIPARGGFGGGGGGQGGGSGSRRTPTSDASGATGASDQTSGSGNGQAVADSSQSSGTATPAATQPAQGSTGGSGGSIPPRLQTAIAADQVPPALMTSIAQGTIPARGGFGGGGQGGGGFQRTPGASGTASAAGGPAGPGGAPGSSNSANGGAGGQGNGGSNGSQRNGGNGQGGNGRSANGPRPLTVGGPSVAETFPTSQNLIQIALVGAGLITLAGLILFFRERNRDEFDASYSPGLLYAGAGVFVLVAALLLPGLPGEMFGVTRARAAGIPQIAANVVLPARVMAQTSTPTDTPNPSATPTGLPTLTPVPSTSATALFTQVAMANNQDSSTSSCTIVAQTALNLRGDPSAKNEAIGKIFAGSLLTVTGQTADKKWWRVVSGDMGSKVEGWVSSDFITVEPSCALDSLAVVGPSLTPSRTPSPTRTPRGTPSSATQAATQQPTSAATAASAVSSCTLITTTPASLRADPSKTQAAIAQIPDGTALTATGRSVDGVWWRVTYSGQDGWIGAGAVLSAATCTSLPSLTLTPKP